MTRKSDSIFERIMHQIKASSGAGALAKPVSNHHRNERNCKSGNALARCHASFGRADETGGYDGKVGSPRLMTMRRSNERRR